MRSPSLAILWYGSCVLTGVILFRVFGGPAGVGPLVTVVLVTLLLADSVRPRHLTEARRLLGGVLLPLLAMVGLGGVIAVVGTSFVEDWSEPSVLAQGNQASTPTRGPLIDHTTAELVDLQVVFLGDATMTGLVHNTGSTPLGSLDLTISLLDDNQVVGQVGVIVKLVVPPGETRSFTGTIDLDRPPALGRVCPSEDCQLGWDLTAARAPSP